MIYRHPRKIFICFITIIISILLLQDTLLAERIFFAGYKGGFYIRSEEEGGMELRLGGSFQADYRYYAEKERADNRFDIRKARLIFNGQLTQWFRFAMEYEFQGNETSNLVDAYGEWVISGLQGLRFGQFKVPFGLEWQGSDKSQWFAERSMGYYLNPQRDIGVMLYGSMFQDSLNYGLGAFNGDGDDGSTRGSRHDAPEVTGRLVFKPLSFTSMELFKNAQIGFSAGYSKIDTVNVDLKVKSTGMAGLTRNLYVLSYNTKFGVLQDVDKRLRRGLEGVWAWRWLALTGEYTYLKFTDLETATKLATGATYSTYCLSAACCVTGEHIRLSRGVIQPIYPDRFFNPTEGTFGALCLAGRYDHFSGDEDWINSTSYVSVRSANAISASATWILFPMYRIILDYTKTKFTDPIRVRVNPDGTVDYIEKETVLTLRMAMDF